MNANEVFNSSFGSILIIAFTIDLFITWLNFKKEVCCFHKANQAVQYIEYTISELVI